MCGHDIRYAPYRQMVLFHGPLIFWTKDKKLKLCVTLVNQTVCHENITDCGGIAPRYLMDSGWKWVVCFTHRLLYRTGKSPRYPLDKMLGGLQRSCGCCEEDKSIAPAGILTSAVHRLDRLYIDWAIQTIFFCICGRAKFSHVPE
jgi:hypothetical protein